MAAADRPGRIAADAAAGGCCGGKAAELEVSDRRRSATMVASRAEECRGCPGRRHACTGRLKNQVRPDRACPHHVLPAPHLTDHPPAVCVWSAPSLCSRMLWRVPAPCPSLPTTYHHLPPTTHSTTYHLPPTTCHLPPTTDHLPPTTCCLLCAVCGLLWDGEGGTADTSPPPSPGQHDYD